MTQDSSGVERGQTTHPLPRGSSLGRFRVIIFSSIEPRKIARLAARIHAEAPEAQVCAVLYERRLAKPLRKRIASFLKNAPDPRFLTYAARRIFHVLVRILWSFADVALRMIHASPRHPNGSGHYSLGQVSQFCQTNSIALQVTSDIHSPESLEFVRRHQPDLGLVFGTRILKPDLFTIPHQGSINIHKRKVPDYRGGGPIGLWEMLDGQTEIGVTVHRVLAEVDSGAVIKSSSIPIERFDTLTSLALKADVVGNDLLVASVRDFARGTVSEYPQVGAGRLFKSPKPQEMLRYQRELKRRRKAYQPACGQPGWRLIARCLLFGPYAMARNWARRMRGSFPVIILYHHVVTDRPHDLGISTETFLNQVAYLRKHYRIASLQQALAMLESNSVTAPTVVLTFDDGYEDNFLTLRAVIEETSVPVTLFLCPQAIAERRPFGHDVLQRQPGFLPFTREQVVYLSRNGCEIGSYTRSHFDCGSTDEAALRDEIVGSKFDLEAWLKQEVRYFSFSWGHPPNMSPTALRIAKESYRYVFFAYGGENFATQDQPLWYLKRSPHPNDILELGLLLQSLLDIGPASVPGSFLGVRADSPRSRKPLSHGCC